ncbi:MAG TPA: hypothetical protein VN841_11405 [Bryobacteraceae bacterium]|nr:hypothetical protein [Bryobacteraceae bacterium]
MTPDPEFLRRHYASLTDEALRAIHRADLVEAAQQCYDDELKQRRLPSQQATPAPRPSTEPTRELPKASTDADATVEKPDWLEDAAEVLTRPGTGNEPADVLVEARDVLEAAEIPCYLNLFEIPEEPVQAAQPTHEWRLLVPGDLGAHAQSVLERDIFNADFEAGWKTHLEMLSDQELVKMNPQEAFCGLFDRVERVTRVYEEERSRRGLK